MPKTAAAMIEVPCPDCGELSAEPAERVASNDVIPCSLCGGLIDLADESCRAAVSEAKRIAARNEVQRP